MIGSGLTDDWSAASNAAVFRQHYDPPQQESLPEAHITPQSSDARMLGQGSNPFDDSASVSPTHSASTLHGSTNPPTYVTNPPSYLS
jgi:hypothetical protein